MTSTQQLNRRLERLEEETGDCQPQLVVILGASYIDGFECESVEAALEAGGIDVNDDVFVITIVPKLFEGQVAPGPLRYMAASSR